MKHFSTLFFIFLFSLNAISQMPGRAGNGQNMNAGHLYGKIVDSATNKGIDAASVQLMGKKFDSVSKKVKPVILGTVITSPNGDFSLESLPVMGNFTLRISAVGYIELIMPFSFGIKFQQGGSSNQQDRLTQMLGMIDKDLGNLKLQSAATTLAGVTVVSTGKPFFEMGVDRKIFNVDKNIVTTGQTATELMKQIPSLNVDIDGNVTMRNASPQIFIDGRPTTLTLDQIPADVIDRVELITNPSAKYDASGGNGGILNIVLKKNIKKGYNGGIRAGVDSRGKFNGGGDINYRQGKLNFSLSGTVNQRKSIFTSVTDRYNISDTPSYVHVDDKGTNVGYFAFIRAGIDYFVDNRNTFSFAGNFNRGMFTSTDNQLIDSTIENVFSSYSNRATVSKFNFKNSGTQLSYKHNFTENGHDISADLNYNSSTNTSNGNYTTNTFLPDNNPKGLPLIQQTQGNGYNRFLTIQSDYENPYDSSHKIEAGVRAAIRNYKSESLQSFFDNTSGKFINIPSISNNYKFRDEVFAAYVTYTLKTKKWNYQLGLRAESSNYNGSLIGKDSTYKTNFPISIFPSSFITYRLNDKEDLQVNYSRRINRPNFFQLLPFVDVSDPQNPSIGNPSLSPEFTNSLELSYDKNYKNNSNFLATVYFKYSTDLITRYQFIGPNPLNPEDTVVFNTFANANSSTSYGLELTNRTTIKKIWDVTLNVNLYNSKINGTNLESTLTNQRTSWFAKWNNNVKLPKKFSLQLSANYQSKTVLPIGGGGGRGGGGGFFGGGSFGTAQGYIYPNYSFDFAIKKDWQWKGGNSASITLSINDIFRTAINKTYSTSPYFTQIVERRRDPQVARINFSYRFGKFDATLFKRKNTKADQSGGMDIPVQ